MSMKTKYPKYNRKSTPLSAGFTLIEILVVIGIIALLATIVIAAINPAKQFAQARNTQRQSNVEAILNAIGQRMADNKGIFAGTFGAYTCPPLPTSVGLIYTGSSSVAGAVDLSCLVPTYIPILSSDPNATAGSADTLYTVQVSSAGRVSVCAPQSLLETAIPDHSTEICVTR